jgi:hypothetical protein
MPATCTAAALQHAVTRIHRHHQLFSPTSLDTYICVLSPHHSCRGETVRVHFPVNPVDRQALQGHYDDYEAAIAAQVGCLSELQPPSFE